MQQSSVAIDYRELDGRLAVSELNPSAAEAHGILCAMLCAGDAQAEESWIADLLAGADDAELATQECRHTLEDLAAFTREGFADLQRGFAPLLPDDSAALAERALGLYDWSRGFLYGLGLAGVGTGHLSEQAQEAFADFAAITHLDLDDLDDSEENEQALMELTEFVRVAAMLVYEERGRPGESGG
jgi:hypothetical protein